jgi:hypothetical protein
MIQLLSCNLHKNETTLIYSTNAKLQNDVSKGENYSSENLISWELPVLLNEHDKTK